MPKTIVLPTALELGSRKPKLLYKSGLASHLPYPCSIYLSRGHVRLKKDKTLVAKGTKKFRGLACLARGR